MAFILESDLLVYMEQEEIDQITDGDGSIIPAVIRDAEEFGAELIRQRIDIDFEYSQTGEDRHNQLLKQLVAVALYYLSERLPTNVLPENREIAFQNAETWFKDVAAGHRMTTLKKLDEENQVGFSIRYGNGTASGGNHY